MPSSGSHRHRSYSREREESRRKHSRSPERGKHARHERDDDAAKHRRRREDRWEKERDGYRESSSSKHTNRHTHRHRHRDDDHRRKFDEREVGQRNDYSTGKMRLIDDDNPDNERGPHREMFTDQGQGSLGEKAVASIPTSDDLKLSSHATSSHKPQPAPLPSDAPTVTQIRRDEWMLPKEDEGEMLQSGGDFFSNLGGYTRKRPPPQPPKPNPDELRVSSREINQQFIQGKHIDEYDAPRVRETPTPGAPGSQWRMMKLRRVYEAAEEEGKGIEEVALERYGSIEAFNDARRERQILDDQERGRNGSGGPSSGAVSMPASRIPSRQSSFRKPGERTSTRSSPGVFNNNRDASASTTVRPTALSRLSEISSNNDASSKPSTPVPNVFNPIPSKALQQDAASDTNGEPPLSATALNKLSAKVLRAEMMSSTEARGLRAQLEREKAKAASHSGANLDEEKPDAGTEVRVLPTLDVRGRLYDVGTGKDDAGDTAVNGSRAGRKKEQMFETRDAKTGELLRYNRDDDEQTLADLVREERFNAGSASQKSMDSQMASQIAADKSFKADVDYMDDNVERLGRRKMKSDALKRMFAVQDFAKTKKALDTCTFCWQENERSPRASIVSSGTRTFLALPDTQPLVDGHCLIVPMQHHLSMLEADEDTTEEVKNFMKCLMQMAAANGKGVVFYETVKSLKHQRHTFIECIPIEQSLYSQLPTYFRQSILDAGDEWSQNKRLIEFTQPRPFKRSMVAHLPYFMVQFDYRGENGYGHVIEDGDGANDGQTAGDDDGFALDMRGRGGSSDFPRWFAAEIIGNLMEYEPQRWRKPRRLRQEEREQELARFNKQWSKYDWTPMLQQAAQS